MYNFSMCTRTRNCLSLSLPSTHTIALNLVLSLSRTLTIILTERKTAIKTDRHIRTLLPQCERHKRCPKRTITHHNHRHTHEAQLGGEAKGEVRGEATEGDDVHRQFTSLHAAEVDANADHGAVMAKTHLQQIN
jgi:hypothetical protein